MSTIEAAAYISFLLYVMFAANIISVLKDESIFFPEIDYDGRFMKTFLEYYVYILTFIV